MSERTCSVCGTPGLTGECPVCVEAWENRKPAENSYDARARLEDTLTSADWNALRVLVDDHADAALARVLVAEKHGQPADGARVACGQAERLQRKVRAASRASEEPDDD